MKKRSRWDAERGDYGGKRRMWLKVVCMANQKGGGKTKPRRNVAAEHDEKKKVRRWEWSRKEGDEGRGRKGPVKNVMSAKRVKKDGITNQEVVGTAQESERLGL